MNTSSNGGFQEMGALEPQALEAYNKLLDMIGEGKTMRDVAQAYVAFVVSRNNGNKFHAAKRLQVDRRSLQRWAKGKKAGTRGRSRVNPEVEPSLSPE
jgi:transcriptional regulator with PAS, ATPase and Fis domain